MPEYIEREKTVELLRSLGSRDYRRENGTIQDAIETLSSPEYTPAADVAPVVHGRWVKVPVPLRKGKYAPECSHCKQRLKPLNGELIYCPVCGAKMDLENETEEK